MNDYTYAVARIRALETKLTTKSDVENLLETTDTGIVSFLHSRNFGSLQDQKLHDIEPALNNELDSILTLVYTLVPETDKKLVSIFRLEYDFHNFLVLHKNRYLNRETNTDEFSSLGTITPDSMKLSLEKPELIPEPFYSLANILNKTQNISLEECIVLIEKRKWQYFVDTAKKNIFLLNLIRLLIDLGNIKNFVQSKFFQVSKENFCLRLIPDGNLRLDMFEECYDDPWEKFLKFIQLTRYSWINEIPNNDKLWLTDKLCDDYLLDYLHDESINLFFSIGPIINYVFLKKQEIKMLRTIYTGKKNNVAKSELRQYINRIYA